MIGTLNDICIVVIVALRLYRLLLLLVVVRAISTIVLDAFFVGQFQWSLNLEVTGVALTNIAVGVILLIPSALILIGLDWLAGARMRQAATEIKLVSCGNPIQP